MMDIFLADCFDDNGCPPIMVHYRVIFLWIYMPIRRTHSFIVNDADLEYTKKNNI